MVRGAPRRPAAGDETYAIFPESRNAVWSPFPEDTDYWPAEKQGMVNFTVDDLDAMLAQLRDAGVEVDEKIEVLDGIGRFGWAVDPEGNRFELWEPAATRQSVGRRSRRPRGSGARALEPELRAGRWPTAPRASR